MRRALLLAAVSAEMLCSLACTSKGPLELMNNQEQPAPQRPRPIILTGAVAVLFGIIAIAVFQIIKPRLERIAFESKRDGNFKIYIMNADGSEQERLTFNDADDKDAKISRSGKWTVRLTNNPANDSNPHWSSDGKWIFFQSDRDGDFEIYRMKADGSETAQLTYNETEDFLGP